MWKYFFFFREGCMFLRLWYWVVSASGRFSVGWGIGRSCVLGFICL